MAAKLFDLVVIGTGTAGFSVATKCRGAGLSVAIIDHKPFGGTCALRGCDPKKVLVGLAEALDQVNRFQGKGITGEVKINWEQMMNFKETFTAPVPEKREESLLKKEIAVFHGHASFNGKNTVKVNTDELIGKHILIATGSSAMEMPFEGSSFLLDNEEFLNLKQIPQHLLFVGGGYISMEFAHIAARAGSSVTIVNDQSKVLANFDPYLVSLLERRSTEVGIKIINQASVSGVKKKGGVFEVKIQTNDKEIYLSADLVIHGAGRTPNISRLNLSQAEVKADKGGVEVNEFGQSVSNLAVYAAGDVANRGLPLTPVASFEAHIVASNIINGNTKKLSFPPVPSVAFTIPHIASVGLSEEEAQKQNINYKLNCAETAGWFSAKRIAESCEGYKIILSQDEKKILGAHLLGHKADEVINLFAMAIKEEIAPEEIKKMIMAYPTSSSDISYML